MTQNGKRVENKRVWHLGGFLSYYFLRTLPDGKPFRYVLHLSPNEQCEGRAGVAKRIRQARNNMQQSMKDRSWKR